MQMSKTELIIMCIVVTMLFIFFVCSTKPDVEVPQLATEAIEPSPTPTPVIPSPTPIALTRLGPDIKVVLKGTFKANHYCLKGRTALGNFTKEGITVAVDPAVIPLHSVLYIEGYGIRIAQDTGADIKGNTLDIYIPSYDECIKLGSPTVKVWLLK